MPSDYKNVVVYLRNNTRDIDLLRWIQMIRDRGENPRDIIRKILLHAVHGFNLDTRYTIPESYMEKPAEMFSDEKVALKVKPADHQLIKKTANELSDATGSFIAVSELAKILLRDSIIIKGEERSDDIRSGISRTEAFASIVAGHKGKSPHTANKSQEHENNTKFQMEEKIPLKDNNDKKEENTSTYVDTTVMEQEREVAINQGKAGRSNMTRNFINPSAITKGIRR